MKTEKELRVFYEQYINKPLYRAIPSIDYEDIKRKGINPHINPYENLKVPLQKLVHIILRLEKEGYSMELKWGSIYATGSFAVRNMLDDVKKEFIDFASTKKHVEFYSRIVAGGALAVSIKRVTDRLLEDRPFLTGKEWKLIERLNKEAKKRIGSMNVFYINGSSKLFEQGLMHLIIKKKKLTKLKISYLPSPFGSFEHFKKIITKQGFRKYSYWLKSGNYYLRIKEKIPAKKIIFNDTM